jgi:SAM-dependent methyltransferase
MDQLFEDNRNIYTAYRREHNSNLAERCRKLRALVSVKSGTVLEIGALDYSLLSLFDGFQRFASDLVVRRFPSNLPFFLANTLEGLPCTGATFDVVVAGELIEHVLDTEKLVSEIFRTLKPGGEIVLSTPNTSFWRNFLQLLLKQNPFWVDWKNGQEGHVRYFSPVTLRTLLEDAGFDNVRLTTIQDIDGGNPILRIVGKIIERTSPMYGMLILARGMKTR